MEASTRINASRIVRLSTMGSMWDHGTYLWAWDDQGNTYRITTQELIKLFNSNTNFIPVLKRKYYHLKVAEGAQ